MVKGNHPKMAASWLVNYYHLPRLVYLLINNVNPGFLD